MGIVGLMPAAKPTPIHFHDEGRTLILLGGLGSADHEHFGGTEYAKVIMNALWGLPPQLDMVFEKRVHDAMRRIVAEGLAESAHDLSDGGLAVAAAECSFGPAEIGAWLALDSDLAPELLLFHEGPSRILISTSQPEKIMAIAREFGVESPVVGVTIKKRLQLSNRSQVLLDCDLATMKDQWQTAFGRALNS